jgi:nucleotide-binding universal stress UspA family protein
MEKVMSADRITRALQNYLSAEPHLNVERAQIDAAAGRRQEARHELESALHSAMLESEHPLACTVRDMLAGKVDPRQAQDKLQEFLRAPAAHATKPIILIAIDGSDAAMWAAAAGGELAGRIKAHVLLVHVSPPTEAFAPEGYVTPAYYIELHKRGEALLEKARALLPANVESTIVLEDGEPAHQIALLGQERGVDYIFVGTHGRGRIGQLLIGSTATTVARLATCPVVVISHPPGRAESAVPKQRKKVSERILEKLNPAEVPLE